MTSRELELTIRSLLERRLPDGDLRSELERLAVQEQSFSGFTWLWGPELYRRNRVFFRPFILSRFSTYMVLPKWRVENIRWKGTKATILDGWLSEADRLDDVELFKLLYRWKLTAEEKRDHTIVSDLLSRFRGASTPAGRQIVLRKFDLWFELDEPTALALYMVDSKAVGSFILPRLRTGWLSGDPKRQLWQELLKAADARNDQDFRWKLYRKQVPLSIWTRDCLDLCSRIQDNGELAKELEKRHPDGAGLNLADGFYKIVQARGRDVFPYVTRHLRQVWGGWIGRGSYGKIADYARAQGWWDFWSVLIRSCAGDGEYNKEVRALLEDARVSPEESKKRLLALAGVSREWNWGGFGAASVHQLEEPVALLFHDVFPDLLRGPFKLHVQSHRWGKTYPRLLEKFIEANDEEMVDFVASRLVTRCGRWGNADKMISDAERLADYYASLKMDEAVFSRRAARVLGQIPAYTIWNYNDLIKENRLARLLFERSASSYLADPPSLADLVEASEIHVMALAYRALGLNDERARKIAALHLPLLLGTLLRPLQRHTRILAFGALANAASDLESATLILARAREAFSLPDLRYPKEQLLGLIARVLHRWPELREVSEQPVIYERAAA